MTTTLILCLVVGVCTLPVWGSPPAVRVRRLEITPTEKDYNSSLPRVYGLRQCEGLGTLVDLRLEGCNPDETCQVFADVPISSELVFIPSEDIPELGVRLNIVHSDGTLEKISERRIPNSGVQKGVSYTARTRGIASNDYLGSTVTIQYILYRVADGSGEICSEADYDVI